MPAVCCAISVESQDNLSAQCVMFRWQLDKAGDILAQRKQQQLEAQRRVQELEADGIDMFS